MRRKMQALAAFLVIVVVGAASEQSLARTKLPPASPNSQVAASPPEANTVIASIALADIGFKDGIRLANLGARREIFVPLPQNADLKLTDLVLHYDDLSAFKARRNLEVLVNERTAATVPLEGGGADLTLRISLAGTSQRDGFIKLTFLYSGAATPDRCIDVRYVGDSLTIKPSTAIDIAFNAAILRDVATIAALMPRDITIALPEGALSASEFAAALTVARALAATGRRTDFATGIPAPGDTSVSETDGKRYWKRGTIMIGAPYTGALPADANTVSPGTLSAIRIGDMPALLLSDASTSLRAARFLAAPSLALARGMASIAVADVSKPQLSGDRVTFDQLGLRPPPVDVYGRAELITAIDIRDLPVDTRLSRLALDVLVAPDGAGDKAVVSLFVNGHFLTSTVAAVDGPTHLEQPLPEGLIGTTANINVVVQRRSAAGDCRFEPQGYPAQILGSSAAILSRATKPHDFSDLVTHWTNGVEVLVPPAAADYPQQHLALLSAVLTPLSAQLAPITVRFAEADAAPIAPFIALGGLPPQGAATRVRFNQGRVAVTDRTGLTLLDLGGFKSGAVAQLVNANSHSGLWIKTLAADGQSPTPAALKLNQGDVAFIDQSGIAFAMSTVRDTLVQITYPDQTTWAAISARFQSWIVGSLWLLATVAFLFALQGMLRRRPRNADD
jgi:hypothetical protein